MARTKDISVMLGAGNIWFRAGVALALVCLLVLTGILPTQAQARPFPDDGGSFDVSVNTDVVPTADPDARLVNVVVCVSDDVGAHVKDARVSITLVPPNAPRAGGASAVAANTGGASASTGASDSVAGAGDAAGTKSSPVFPDDGKADAPNAGSRYAEAANGTTAENGQVALEGAAVSGTYRVVVSKDGHIATENAFVCAGTDGEVWEVVLAKVPADQPSDGQSGGQSGGDESVWSRLLATGDGLGPMIALLVVAGAFAGAVAFVQYRRMRGRHER